LSPLQSPCLCLCLELCLPFFVFCA
jgi:hypothetical protein